jgi:hypothetical protein
MGQRYAAAAVQAVLENRPRVMEALVARRPDALATAWTAVLQALGAVTGIETARFVAALVPLLRGGGRRMSLDEPIDADGNRMVHWAAMYGHADDLVLFKHHGADLRAPNRLGTTPLFDAVRGGCPATVETIVRQEGRGVLDHANEYDCTAMHWACKHVSLRGAEGLHRLDLELLNRPNRRGCLPLDVLEWRELYHADLARRTLGRPPTLEELRPFRELRAWMLTNGARHSVPWEMAPAGLRLRRVFAPLNADRWWSYVRPPFGWAEAA